MSNDVAHAGQAVYTPFTLGLYDALVLGVSCRWIWRCPSSAILANYQTHISPNHLDVGVGSGYFLDQLQFDSAAQPPRIVLMDMNANSLSHCAARIARYNPETMERNVLAPLPFEGKRFDSLGMNLLFHCLPGDMASKAAALDNLLPLVNPGARVFGCTLLQGGVKRSGLAKRLMKIYNRKGIFSNRNDSLAALQEELEQRLDQVEIRVEGCGALFPGVARQD